MRSDERASVVRVGALRLEIQRYADGRYGFDYKPPGDIRRKIRLHSLRDAEARAREVLGAAHGGQVDRLAIDEDEFAEFLRWKSGRGKGGVVGEFVVKYLASKETKGVRSESVRKWGCDLRAFSEVFGARKIDTITRQEITDWLNARNVGPRRWNNLLETLVALTRFARRDGCVPVHATGAELVEKRRVSVTVATYTPDELRRILAVVEREWLPAIVLGAFCGLRPQEVCPDPESGKPWLVWGNVLWEKRKIDVPANVSKVRKRRFAPLTEPAIAFLEPWRDADPAAPLTPRQRFAGQTARWGREAGVKWKPDALRHSFASYRLALIPDMAALALEMGNSPTMLFRHYLDLKHTEEAREWFSIRPAEFQMGQKQSPGVRALKPHRAHRVRTKHSNICS